jgi:hypothetical protein
MAGGRSAIAMPGPRSIAASQRQQHSRCRVHRTRTNIGRMRASSGRIRPAAVPWHNLESGSWRRACSGCDSSGAGLVQSTNALNMGPTKLGAGPSQAEARPAGSGQRAQPPRRRAPGRGVRERPRLTGGRTHTAAAGPLRGGPAVVEVPRCERPDPPGRRRRGTPCRSP